jgi:hypothetical protein
MATSAELIKERQLLTGMGLPPVKVWPPRCTWYNPDGSVNGHLPCDPYSRLLYMSRGLRPDVASTTLSPSPPPVASADSLPEAVKSFMDGQDVWEGTATELLSTLEGTYEGLPADGTRLSKTLFKLASQLAVRGISVERLRRGKQRGIRLYRR